MRGIVTLLGTAASWIIAYGFIYFNFSSIGLEVMDSMELGVLGAILITFGIPFTISQKEYDKIKISLFVGVISTVIFQLYLISQLVAMTI